MSRARGETGTRANAREHEVATSRRLISRLPRRDYVDGGVTGGPLIFGYVQEIRKQDA